MDYPNVLCASLIGSFLLATACGSDDSKDSGTGGAAGKGGSSATGGAKATGGSNAASGGSTAKGGNTGTGGTNQAGSGQGGANAGANQGGASSGGATSDHCDAIYLLDAPSTATVDAPGDITLWEYQPNQTDISQSTLTSVGKVECPDLQPFFEIPFSMAVDRNGIAWTVFSKFTDSIPMTDKLFKIDVSDAKCTATTYATKNTIRAPYSMSFVADSPSAEETMLVAPLVSGQQPIGEFDLEKLELTATSAELENPLQIAGNSAGKLFGFMRSPELGITEIDRSTGNLGEVSPIADAMLEGFRGWPIFGYATWGGEHWVFIGSTGDKSTTVFRVDVSGKVSSTKLDGRFIISASASTCAPAEPG